MYACCSFCLTSAAPTWVSANSTCQVGAETHVKGKLTFPGLVCYVLATGPQGFHMATQLLLGRVNTSVASR